MRRREFIAGVGSAALSPFTANAQLPDRVRRVGFLSGSSEQDPLTQELQSSFWQRLSELGWQQGRNLRIDERFAAGDSARYKIYAAELVALAPDVLVSNTTPAVAALRATTDQIPIVFHQISDPIAAGFVASLAHPSGNLTGFTNFEYTVSGKWLELLKSAILDLKLVEILMNPDDPATGRYLGALEQANDQLGFPLRKFEVRGVDELRQTIDGFSYSANRALVVLPTSLALIHRRIIIDRALKAKLPAIYGDRPYVADGGLMSYGPSRVDITRGAAAYVDRILRGEKVADLPVVQPNKIDLVINLKTAKALGLTIPETLLATADEVIQ